MSTIDPAAVRAARRNRRPGPATIAAALLLQVVGGALMGYGWLALFGNTITNPDDAFDPSIGALVGVIGGLPVTIIGSLVWMGVVMKRSDVGLLLGWGVFWIGGGVGVFIASLSLAGLVILPVVAVACVVIGLVFVVLSFVARAKRAALTNQEAEIMRTGVPVTATVSDRGFTHFRESDRIITTVTFTFTDAQGVQRWVQRMMKIHAADPIENGQQTQLWYDRLDPANDKKIVVKLAVDAPVR